MAKASSLIIVTALLLFALLAVSFFTPHNAPPTPSQSSDYVFANGTFSYTQERDMLLPRLQRSPLNLSANESFEVYHTSFASRPLLNAPTRIAALLFVPKAAANANRSFPAVVFLPGGGGTKESRAPIAALFARAGYATLVIDQRGIGETAGQYLDVQSDYRIFAQRAEPMQHLAVYDALRSFDILRAHPTVNQSRIILTGESMGARYALIAAALDKRISGVLAISASGFNIPFAPEQQGNDYLRSIDPDTYISQIAPRPLAMLHDPNDSIVLLADAQRTFEKAGEPKRFWTSAGCNHGYCPAMNRSLDEALRFLDERATL